MYDVEKWVYDGSLRSLLSVFAALLSVGAAVYTTFILKRLTKRDPYPRKELRSELDEWMFDVRQNYAKNIRVHGKSKL